MIPGGRCTCTTASPGIRSGSVTWPCSRCPTWPTPRTCCCPRTSSSSAAAVWRVHSLDRILRKAWQAGIVLAGSSAGGICWFDGGTTDSFGSELRAFTDGLGLLAGSYCPHYDSEPGRRPLYHRLIADGTLPAGIACDDGAAAHFTDDTLTELIADRPGAGAYRVEPGIAETRLETRFLG